MIACCVISHHIAPYPSAGLVLHDIYTALHHIIHTVPHCIISYYILHLVIHTILHCIISYQITEMISHLIFIAGSISDLNLIRIVLLVSASTPCDVGFHGNAQHTVCCWQGWPVHWQDTHTDSWQQLLALRRTSL